MNIKNASLNRLGAAPWKFLLLAAALLFSYALPVHADDHEEAPAVADAAGVNCPLVAETSVSMSTASSASSLSPSSPPDAACGHWRSACCLPCRCAGSSALLRPHASSTRIRCISISVYLQSLLPSSEQPRNVW